MPNDLLRRLVGPDKVTGGVVPQEALPGGLPGMYRFREALLLLFCQRAEPRALPYLGFRGGPVFDGGLLGGMQKRRE